MAGHERLHLAFYGDDLSQRFTRIASHDRQQCQYLDELVAGALPHWHQIAPQQRDYARAKNEFTRRFV